MAARDAAGGLIQHKAKMAPIGAIFILDEVPLHVERVVTVT